MRSTNIYKNNPTGIDLILDGSSLYDLTVDSNLNDIDMNLIYEKTLATDGLVVDADIANKNFFFLKNVGDASEVSPIVPNGEVPTTPYFQYQYKTDSYTMFEDRMEKGWTAEFIFSFNDTVTGNTLSNVLFYMGKIQNTTGSTTGDTSSMSGNTVYTSDLSSLSGSTGSTGTTIYYSGDPNALLNDPSLSGYTIIVIYDEDLTGYTGQTTDFVDNNFTISVNSSKQLVFQQVKYISTCNCDTPDLEIRKVNHLSIPLLRTTGTTNHHLVVVFQRNIGLEGEDLIYNGNNIDCSNFPNRRWFDGKKYRMGKLQIFFDGLYKGTINDVEETIFRNTITSLPQVQGWGLSDPSFYELSSEYKIAGHFTGNMVRGRYYEAPLSMDQIKINFELFAALYGILDPLSSC